MYVLDMWAGKPDHSKPDPFMFGLIRRISDQSLHFPLGLVVPMPMMKKPAMQKKPAGCTDLVPYKKARSEQDEHEEPEVEEGEEGEEEEENEPDEEEAEEKEEKKQEPAPRLSKQALNDHTRFVQEACDKKLTQDQVEDAMRKTSPKTQMSLWKAFEADRVASGEQEQYVKAAAGPGNQKRKRKMLGRWILDGGRCTKHYKQAIQLFQIGARSGCQWLWLSRTEAERRIGPEELKDRVSRGTIKYRRNPEDGKYWQFRFLGC